MSSNGPIYPPPGTGPVYTQIGSIPEVTVPGGPWWKRWWALLAAALVIFAVGVGTGSAISGGSDSEASPSATTDKPGRRTTTTSDQASEDTDPPEATDPTATETTDTTEAPTTTSTEAPTTTAAPDDVVAGAPAGRIGDRDDPVAVGKIADAGEGWRLQVLEVIDDGTAQVMEANQFNDPPPSGARFSLVTVALGYFGFDDPNSGFDLTIAGVGASARQLDTDCGVTPSPLPVFEDMFSGGVVIGNLCFVTEAADTGALQVYTEVGFDGDTVFLDASSTPKKAEPMRPLFGTQEGASASEHRSSPTAVGDVADLGDGWSLTVTGPATDITDQVMGENQFNDPAPDGFRFVGFPVELQYDGDGSANGFDVTLKAVGDSNLQLSEDCGVVPGALDRFVDVFAGGTITGTACFVVPEAQVSTVVAYAQTGFDGGYTYFATK